MARTAPKTPGKPSGDGKPAASPAPKTSPGPKSPTLKPSTPKGRKKNDSGPETPKTKFDLPLLHDPYAIQSVPGLYSISFQELNPEAMCYFKTNQLSPTKFLEQFGSIDRGVQREPMVFALQDIKCWTKSFPFHGKILSLVCLPKSGSKLTDGDLVKFTEPELPLKRWFLRVQCWNPSVTSSRGYVCNSNNAKRFVEDVTRYYTSLFKSEKGSADEKSVIKHVREKTTIVIIATTDSKMFAKQMNEPVDLMDCLLYTSPSPRDQRGSRMPSSA